MGEDKGFEKDIELEYRCEDASLGQRAVVSGAWVFSFKTVQRLLGLIRTVILARLLAPEDFGLMGIALLAINTLETFSKTGFEQALIQKREDIRDYLDSAWTVQIIRSLILFCFLFAGAPLVAIFFKSQQATHIIRVLALIELFMGAKNIGIVYFQKELRFDKRFILESCGLIASVTVSIVLAFVLRNVWALVYGSLAGAFVTCIVSYAAHQY
ncbi:MAG: oligosaccharide flippase family protein, partial [Candidatus Omnitrophota bacterium]